MHVESIRLKCFKKFRDDLLDFTDRETGLARPLVVLVGDNGSGKSTILQPLRRRSEPRRVVFMNPPISSGRASTWASRGMPGAYRPKSL